MKYFLWRLFGRRWWMSLKSIYQNRDGERRIAHWEQKRGEIRNHTHGRLDFGHIQQICENLQEGAK